MMSESQLLSQETVSDTMPRLRRVLKLRDLIFYGIIVITPIAPIPIFGIVQKLSNGHALLTILIAMVAMVLTAISYGRMASIYPQAGSAYTYVGMGLNAHLGFMAGWAMFLDYLMIPLLNTVYIAVTLHNTLLPQVPYWVLSLLTVAGMTILNLRGIRTTATANSMFLFAAYFIIGVLVILAVRYLWLRDGLYGIFSLQPLYNPQRFHWNAILAGAPLAALTYIGFDGVTTLAEDVENPKRNVMLATVLVCVITGLFSGLLIYLGHQVWPNFETYPNVDTAYMDVAKRAGGPILLVLVAGIVVVADFGSGFSGQVGAARLLFGMGRDGILPRKVFASLDSRSNPSINIIIIGLLAFAGSLFMSFEQCAAILNFGAFLAFMGVNLACFWQFYSVRQEGRRRSFFKDAVVPGIAFFVTLAIWLNLSVASKIIGSIWFLVGLLYLGIKTRGFRVKPSIIRFDET
jgi:putrescine importer